MRATITLQQRDITVKILIKQISFIPQSILNQSILSTSNPKSPSQRPALREAPIDPYSACLIPPSHQPSHGTTHLWREVQSAWVRNLDTLRARNRTLDRSRLSKIKNFVSQAADDGLCSFDGTSEPALWQCVAGVDLAVCVKEVVLVVERHSHFKVYY